jgi:hypothetical protein
MKRMMCLLALSCATFILSASDNVVLRWNQAALDAIKATSMAPPMSSRALAIVHTCMFDAWAAYDKKAIGTRIGDMLRRPKSERTKANKEKAISFAAYKALTTLFSSQTASFQSLMTSLGYDYTDTSTALTTAVGIGNLASYEVLDFRKHDGANQLGDEPGSSGSPYSDYTGYTPVNSSSVLNNPSRWQPLSISGVDQTFLTPHWGLVIPFALEAGNEFRPKDDPHLYPSKGYKHQAEKIIKISAKLNDRTKSIAEYWAAGSGTVTPPGMWNQVAQFVSRRDKNSLDDDVKLFFILNNAMMDSGIAAWDAKRHYDSIRPVSAIRFLFNNKTIKAWAGAGLGTKEILGQNFQSYISTPRFPEYVSGHSTYSASAAEVLKLFTGSDKYRASVKITKGSSTIEPGITPSKTIKLSWKTFTEACEEAGMSRLYGGIHFMKGNLDGQKMGMKVGKKAFERAQFFINGE